MPKINVLDKEVSELIAAGEVVDRPASIVKELMENSIDAGAAKLTVEIKNGGISYIRITDDGCGIDREDVAKAFIRHATSKVHTQDDLAEISSFGFRGEALASVAAVSRVEILTRTENEISGTRYGINGSVEQEICDAGCPVGTTIVVRDLFYNTPARMKFLKKDATEGSAIATVVDKLALANPQVAIRFIRDSQIKLNTSGNGDLISVIYAVHGKEFATGLIPVDFTHEFVRVQGYICKPSEAKATRALQSFFVNSRFVRSKTCMAALEEAYKSSIMTGKFPACVLNISIPYDTVDVNVHPTKIEVRFSNEKIIFDAVYHACKTVLSSSVSFAGETAQPQKKTAMTEFALRDVDYSGKQQRFSAEAYRQIFAPQHDKTASLSHTNDCKDTILYSADVVAPYNYNTGISAEPSGAKSDQNSMRSSAKAPEIREVLHFDKHQIPDPTTEEKTSQLTGDSENIRPAKVIGELFSTYILVEQEDNLILVDKHAAHERILYNKLKASLEMGDRQILISPVAVTLSRTEYTAAVFGSDSMLELGFAIDDFGDGTVLVREIPTMLAEKDISITVQEIASALANGSTGLLPTAMEKLLDSMACRAAIKANDKTPYREMEEIVRMVEERPDVRFCPHGRPVFIKLTKAELEKMFGRLV